MKLRSFIGNIVRPTQKYLLNMIDKPVVVLIYHRVTSLERDPQLLAVEPDNFYRQIEYLRKNYNILDIEEFSYLKQNNKGFPKKSMILTFDDGYADNYLEALPILKKFNSQAIFFVTTSNINTKNELWWDEIERVILTDIKLPKSLKIRLNSKDYLFDTSSKGSKRKTYNALHHLIKCNKADIRDKAINDIICWANLSKKGRSTHRVMTYKEIKLMSKSNSAIIGVHTHTHTLLCVYDHKEQYNDIKKSKDLLEKWTGQKIRYFSYPFGGKKDYNKETLNICGELGFDMAFANFYGQVHSWTHKYQIPRYLVRNWDFELIDFLVIQEQKI